MEEGRSSTVSFERDRGAPSKYNSPSTLGNNAVSNLESENGGNSCTGMH